MVPILLAAETAEQSFSNTLVMIGIALIFCYFILWRPEQKRRQKLESKRKSIEKGDTVIAMGIRAKVHEIKKTTLILSCYDDSKIEMLITAVTEVEKAASQQEVEAP